MKKLLALGLSLALLPGLAWARHGGLGAERGDRGGHEDGNGSGQGDGQAGQEQDRPARQNDQGGRHHGHVWGQQGQAGPQQSQGFNPGQHRGRGLGRGQARPQNRQAGVGPGTGRGQGEFARVRAHRPEPIRNSSRVLATDRFHSQIALPSQGPDGRHLGASLVSPREFDRSFSRRLDNINRPARIAEVEAWNRTEVRANTYYWHHEHGWNFCHYYDPWGYHWYGWYLGPRCFWTRFYLGQWWWYDAAFDRWLFWHNGFFWWQDPFLRIYMYDPAAGLYQPAEGTVPNAPSQAPQAQAAGSQAFFSPDNSRQVKILASGDAFLYDNSNTPAFSPLYLSSRVQSVKFSDTSTGAPLQIMLTLQDNSVQIFDANGRAVRFNDTNSQGQASPAYEPPANSQPDQPAATPAPLPEDGQKNKLDL